MLLVNTEPEKGTYLPVHTSDRAVFQRCPRRWYFSSPMHLNLQPRRSQMGIAEALEFGTMIHTCLEQYYNPALQRDPVETFRTEWYNHYRMLEETIQGLEFMEWWPSWEAHRELGIGMMEYYKRWAPENDNFRVVNVEHDFYIPLDLECRGLPVYYKGRMDAVVQDLETSRYFIIDHKTAGRLDDAFWAKLETDEQCTCVPMNTQALTKSGWKFYDELSVGDEVLAYDGKRTVWTPIQNLVKYDNAPLVSLKNSRGDLSVVCTPNHKWEAEHCYDTRNLKWQATKYRTDSIPKWWARLVLSAESAHSGSLDVTPDEAALLAWIVCDGSVTKHHRSLEVYIGQTKYTEEVYDLLERLGISFSIKEILTVNTNRVHTNFRLSAPQMREIFERFGFESKEDLTAIVLGLSSEARKAFVEVGMQAEGSYKQMTFHQLDGPCSDAFRLAFFLEGYFPTQGNGRSFCASLPTRDSRTLKVESAGAGEVWCMTTEYGNWVMRQGKHISITGNSYAWAAELEAQYYDLEYKEIAGVYYNVLPKRFPGLPTYTYKGAAISLDRQKECTTPELFMRAVEVAELQEWFANSDKAQAYYAWLQSDENQFVFRRDIRRNRQQISNAGDRILRQVKRMIAEKDFDPHFTGEYYCVRCPFRVPCLQMEDGSDPTLTLETNYEVNAERDPGVAV